MEWCIHILKLNLLMISNFCFPIFWDWYVPSLGICNHVKSTSKSWWFLISVSLCFRTDMFCWLDNLNMLLALSVYIFTLMWFTLMSFWLFYTWLDVCYTISEVLLNIAFIVTAFVGVWSSAHIDSTNCTLYIRVFGWQVMFV